MTSEVKEGNNLSVSDVKNEESADESKKVENEVKDVDKDSLKNETKEESRKDASEDEDEEEEEDDDDDDDEEVALLDRPVEVTGCRARKKVERLEMSFSTPKEKQEFPEGKGKKLGDCPRIEAEIQKMKVIDLKPLHKILFNRTGSANEIKKNIRKFNGFPFEKDSSEFNRKKSSVEKLTAPVLKKICLIIDIERGGTKEDIVNRILSFLLNPEDSGRKVATKKKPSKDKKKTTSKKGKSEKKVKPEKDESEDEPEEESVEEDEDSTGGASSMGGTDEEAEALLTEPKKKSKESKSKVNKKKKEKKPKASKRKHADDNDEDSSESSEGEPPAKKSKMPSDEEISKLVKHILESADLQEITMKKVIKQVSDAYPDFDLSHKKAFIKSTIKSIL